MIDLRYCLQVICTANTLHYHLAKRKYLHGVAIEHFDIDEFESPLIYQ